MSDDADTPKAEDEWNDAMQEQAGAGGTEESPASAETPATDDIQQAAMNNLVEDQVAGDSNVELEAILDIPVSLSVRIGQTRLNIRNLLQLNQGSVVELDRLAGEPLDVMVNDTLVAHGEVVVVNEKYGIRMTDIVSAHERVKKLQ